MPVIEFEQLKSDIPEYVFRVADSLLAEGFDAYLVGGAVRDLIMKREPKDYDIATNALPEEIVKIFPRSVSINAKFGTILVVVEDEKGERFDVEVTTFRREEDYFGGRWPAKVEFTSQIDEDLGRRDFTINAMAVSFAALNKGYQAETEVLVDPYQGLVDMEARIIRAVRDPLERFKEDGLRAYKACRLAGELQFEIEAATQAAIKESLDVAKQISMERIRDEFVKLVKYSPQPSLGIDYLRNLGLLELFMPELLENIGVEQPEWHADDVYTHILKTVDLAEDSVKLAALFHDIGKARTKTQDEKGTHFYGHDVVSAQMTEEIMKRMKFGNAQIKRVSSLVRWHMFYYPSADWRKANKIESEDLADGGWSDAAIRRFIKNLGGEDLVDDLFKLRIADAAANPKAEFDPQEIQALEKRIAAVRASDMALKVTDLAINGSDLAQLGVEAGPEMGRILNILLEAVIDNPGINTKDELLAEAAKIKNKAA